MTGQLRVNGKLWHLHCCTLEDQSLALRLEAFNVFCTQVRFCKFIKQYIRAQNYNASLKLRKT